MIVSGVKYNALIDELRFRVFNTLHYCLHFVRGIKAVVFAFVGTRLAPCSLTSTAPIVSFFFHNNLEIKNKSLTLQRKAKSGEEVPPPLLGSNPNFNSEFNDPKSKEKCSFHRTFCFSFFLLLVKEFRLPPLSIIPIDFTKVINIFEIKKFFQEYSTKSRIFNISPTFSERRAVC